ncbi:hypothetical protein FOMPIDRAFT_1041285 [Fomitopsis schrenkii]|uniref:Uncharacterized protein n=1 Tax=Fomitopsis schrenkii TaxID=2126942 RepID=S8E947_FOMSC|nr:hypothetical protein FOMPIDRAFT_1041285 [Fomitopsis schrenkii]
MELAELTEDARMLASLAHFIISFYMHGVSNAASTAGKVDQVGALLIVDLAHDCERGGFGSFSSVRKATFSSSATFVECSTRFLPGATDRGSDTRCLTFPEKALKETKLDKSAQHWWQLNLYEMVEGGDVWVTFVWDTPEVQQPDDLHRSGPVYWSPGIARLGSGCGEESTALIERIYEVQGRCAWSRGAVGGTEAEWWFEISRFEIWMGSSRGSSQERLGKALPADWPSACRITRRTVIALAATRRHRHASSPTSRGMPPSTIIPLAHPPCSAHCVGTSGRGKERVKADSQELSTAPRSTPSSSSPPFHVIARPPKTPGLDAAPSNAETPTLLRTPPPMPPSILPPNQSKSSWWSRAKSGKEPTVRPMRSFSGLNDDSEQSMLPVSAKSKDLSGSRLKTLGSAITFKSKKAASLAIQDLPSDVPIQAPPPPTPPADLDADQTTVAPSPLHSSNKLQGIKSIRTARSTEADTDAKSAHTASEPRTPSDYRTSYQPSVLSSFSEIDPFASGGVIVQQNHDPNRLSAYSDSSMQESSKQRGEILFYNRISYASSSSKSQGHSSDSYSMNPASPRSSRFSRASGSRQNAAGGVKDTSLAPPASPLTGPRRQSPSSSSGSTVRNGDGSRFSEPPPGKLPFQRTSLPFASRSRGMTIGAPEGSDWRPSTAGPSAVPARFRKMSDLPSASPKAPSSSSPISFGRSRSSTVNSAESFESPNMSPSSTARPLVVVRKASSTRVNLPPLSRAPSQDLPPTPFPESIHGASDSLDDLSLYPDADIPSSSSSSLSFAPSMDLDMVAVAGDMINQLMLHSFDDQVGSKSKGKGPWSIVFDKQTAVNGRKR